MVLPTLRAVFPDTKDAECLARALVRVLVKLRSSETRNWITGTQDDALTQAILSRLLLGSLMPRVSVAFHGEGVRAIARVIDNQEVDSIWPTVLVPRDIELALNANLAPPHRSYVHQGIKELGFDG